MKKTIIISVAVLAALAFLYAVGGQVRPQLGGQARSTTFASVSCGVSSTAFLAAGIRPGLEIQNIGNGQVFFAHAANATTTGTNMEFVLNASTTYGNTKKLDSDFVDNRALNCAASVTSTVLYRYF